MTMVDYRVNVTLRSLQTGLSTLPQADPGEYNHNATVFLIYPQE